MSSLSHALRLERSGDHQRAGVHLRVALRRLRGAPGVLDGVLEALDLAPLSTPFLIALLDGTRALRAQLSHRPALLAAVRERLAHEIADPVARAERLAGLG